MGHLHQTIVIFKRITFAQKSQKAQEISEWGLLGLSTMLVAPHE
jgi:hypothetical protein